MRYFFDNMLSCEKARFINHLITQDGHEVVHLRDKFSQDIQDIDWIKHLAEEGNWIVISGDNKISRNPVEREIMEKSGLTWFFLPKRHINKPIIERAYKTLKAWSEIEKYAVRYPKGYIFKLSGGYKIPCEKQF